MFGILLVGDIAFTNVNKKYRLGKQMCKKYKLLINILRPDSLFPKIIFIHFLRNT